MTIRELADRVMDAREPVWRKGDPATAILATWRLSPEDERAVLRVVANAGYRGAELEEVTRRVSARVVDQIEALSDKLPAEASD
jgi:hypothetical protein